MSSLTEHGVDRLGFGLAMRRFAQRRQWLTADRNPVSLARACVGATRRGEPHRA